MDIGLFDNFEDDGQLSLFGMGEGVEDLRETEPEEKAGTKSRETEPGEAGERTAAETRETASVTVREQLPSSGGDSVRIRRCSCCGKMLFVREEENCYLAACNACGVSYVQRT